MPLAGGTGRDSTRVRAGWEWSNDWFATGGRATSGAEMWHPGISMRDLETIETDLMEISAIADDSTKLERIIAWCTSHPDEVPFAMHQLFRWREKHPSEPPKVHPK